MSDTNAPFIPSGVNLASAIPSQGVMSIPEIAGQAETVVKNIMRVEPMLAGMAGMFVPGLSLVQPWIVMIAPYLERALDDLSKNNGGDALTGLLELIQHITSGQPDSPILGNNSPATPTTNAPPASDPDNPQAAGSA